MKAPEGIPGAGDLQVDGNPLAVRYSAPSCFNELQKHGRQVEQLTVLALFFQH